jgi:Fe2+ transport system protein B
MMMYLASMLFALVFVLIAPPCRRFIAQHLEQMNAWAPYSYIVLLLVLIAPIAVIIVINRLPKIVEPEDPMAKYRHEEQPSED